MKTLRTKNQLTDGPIVRTLIWFSIPYLIANALQVAYGVADMVIVGKFSSVVSDISAISNASHIIHVFTYIISSFALGGTVLIGQYLGASRPEDVRESIGTMISLFTILGGIMAIITGLAAEPIARIMKIPEEALVGSINYLRICGAGIIFSTGYHVFGAIMRGLGDSKGPMLFIALACVINIGLDLLFVGVFRMGVEGAAIATVIAQAISILFSVFQLRRKHGSFFQPSLAYFRIQSDKAKQLIKIGLPISLESTIVNISFLLINAMINTFGVVASAAIGINEKIGSLTRLPASSFSSAVAAMVAQNMGANQVKRAHQTLWSGIWISLVLSGIAFLLMQLFPEFFMRIYTNDATTITAGIEYMRSFSFDTILVCFTFCMASFFSGCGRTMFTLARNLASTLLVRIPAAYIFCYVLSFNLFNIGLAPVFASLASILICLVYYKFGKYANKSILSNVEKGLPHV